jgi:ElaB/YqjD/DUF883 family membrane-anchored ribosome-binding protein
VGTLRLVAVSVKASVATVAALLALFAAVDIAHAGVGDIIDDVSGEVEETVGDVEEQADELADAADETVADAKGTADETVADAKETVDETLGQVTETANGAVGAVEEIVDDTPVGGVVDDVKRSIDPVVDVVDQASGLAESAPPTASDSASEIGVESPLRSSAPAAQMTRPETASVPPNAAQKSVSSPVSSALLEQAARPHGTPPVRPIGRPSARIDGGTVAAPHDRLRATPWGQLPVARKDANGAEASAFAKALPFGPLFPVDLPATAAAAAGAAGSALTVALLCALMLLPPTAGRLARPGPILAGPKPWLSLSERPG